jgi:hypothetical protein
MEIRVGEGAGGQQRAAVRFQAVPRAGRPIRVGVSAGDTKEPFLGE